MIAPTETVTDLRVEDPAKAVEGDTSTVQRRRERPVRVLHGVGHLLRGGIEKWLFQTLPPQLTMECEHHVLVRTSEEEAFTSAFRQAGIRVLVCARFKQPIRYLRDFAKLVEDNGPYDVVHVHGASFSGLLTLIAAKKAGIPKAIVHSHNDSRPLLKSRGFGYRTYVAILLRAYRALMDFGFAASVLAAESMFGLDWETNSRCELLYYGVDCKPFEKPRDASLRALLGIPQDAFVIGHVGRFHEQKNHEFLVRVVEETAARSPTAHCLLIGDGPLRAEVEADIKGRNLQDRFTFVPDTTEPADYMTSVMDCFVFPSRYEGLGLVAVEAQAAGLPCIISERVPSEAIVDASLVKVLTLDDSAAEWAEATLALANRKSGSADAARRQVRDSRFNLDHCVAALCARYMGLAGR